MTISAQDKTATTTPRVLIVAQNASAKFGGEAFLPLKYFQLLKKRGHPVTLIAHHRNKAELEALFGDWMQDILLVEDSLLHRITWAIGSRFPDRVQEVVFGNIMNLISEAYQKRLIRQMVKAGSVDVIHQPIPVSPRAPSTLYGFGLPVIIGPMNGGMNYPPGYEDLEGRRTQSMVALTRKAGAFVNRLVPGKRRAAILLVANERTAKALPVPDHPNILQLVENGVDFTTWNRPPDGDVRRDATQFRLVFMGRLIALKAVDITIAAVAQARRAGVDVRFDVLGDGPELAALKSLSAQLGLSDAVTFHGFQPQVRCAEILLGSDALVLNSVRECGGAVVLEAMSLGLPVIAANWGGPADYLDPTCGILLDPVPRASFASRLSDAILMLARNPDHSKALGQAGAAKVRAEFDWEKKADRMLQIYAEAIALHGQGRSLDDRAQGKA